VPTIRDNTLGNRPFIAGALASAAVAFVALLPSGCAPYRPDVTQRCDASPAAVAAAADYLIGRDNARDLDGVIAGYTADVVWLPPAGEPLVGKDSIRSRYESLFSSYQPDLHARPFESFSEHQIGFVRGSTTGTLTPLAGGPAVQVDDKFIAIVRCEAGVWHVSHLMWSPRPAAQGH